MYGAFIAETVYALQRAQIEQAIASRETAERKARASEIAADVERALGEARARRTADAEGIPFREVFEALPAPPELP